MDIESILKLAKSTDRQLSNDAKKKRKRQPEVISASIKSSESETVHPGLDIQYPYETNDDGSVLFYYSLRIRLTVLISLHRSLRNTTRSVFSCKRCPRLHCKANREDEGKPFHLRSFLL